MTVFDVGVWASTFRYAIDASANCLFANFTSPSSSGSTGDFGAFDRMSASSFAASSALPARIMAPTAWPPA